jgi:hypothetical protein
LGCRLSQIPPVGALVTPPNIAPLCRVGGLGAPPRRGRFHAGLVFFWGSAYLSHMLKAFEFCVPTVGTKVPAEAALKNRRKHFFIDGEAVILGVDGYSDFNALHSGKHNNEVQLLAFDVLAMDCDDLRNLPLSMRKANLARLLASDQTEF